MDKTFANQVLATLDETASKIEAFSKEGKVDPKVASELITNIDTFADKFQVAAFGEASFNSYRQKVAKVIEKDPDEPYMKDAFENVQQPRQTDPDEPYMHKTEPSFNSGSIPTYDSDRSSTVSDERHEYNPRDLSEWADSPKKQPSWTGGSGGKSTKQGSTREKTWAP